MNIFKYGVNKIVNEQVINPAIDNFIDGKNSKFLDGGQPIKLEENTDSISIDDVNNNKKNKNKKNGGNVIKLIIILFLLYVIISSNLFTKTILSLFGRRCVNNGSATCFGLIIQGILLVCFYMLFSYLVNKGAI
jgi:hypothetical protein